MSENEKSKKNVKNSNDTNKKPEEHSCGCGCCECENETGDITEINELKIENAAYLELAQRISAEFDNYKKRNSVLAVQSEQKGIIAVIEKILPCIDAFDNAFKMVKDEASKDGLRLIYDQLNTILKSFNVEEIEALNKEFDPNFHNAVFAEEKKGKEGKILEVLQKGYILGDRVIRYSMVKVGK